jgi:beta-1,4-mannosyltransferase
MPTMRPDRPALIVSSTSWTPDEDFGMLLKALALYEGKARAAQGRLPKVLMVVTGKGPDREKYMRQVEKLQEGSEEEPGWQYVRCVSMWLEAADYPIMLGKILSKYGCTYAELSDRLCRYGHFSSFELLGVGSAHEGR